jgi:hypothetical protein
MNKGPVNSRLRAAAGLALLCMLAVLLPAQAQQSSIPAATLMYHAYLPMVGGAAPGSRLFLPMLATGSTVDLSQGSNRAAAASAPQAAASSTSGFVTRRGEELLLNGEPYTFVGTNVSYLAGPFFPEANAEGIVSSLADNEVQVIRVFVGPWCDPQRVMRLVDLAGKYHVRLILTLQDFFGHEDGWWFKGQYETVDLPHIRNIVPLFANRPEVLMWELMNEPTCPGSDSNLSCWDALYKWADVTSREIKRLDPNHLVAVGTQNAGLDDQSAGVFRRIHALGTIDLVSVHRSAGGLPKKELAIAHELGKPIYFGEVYRRGLKESCQPLPDNALERRAQAITADLQSSLQAGVDGYLLWQYAYGGVYMGDHTEYFCGVYDYFSDDPVWEVLRPVGTRRGAVQ